MVAVVDTPAVASGMFAHDHHALEAQRAEDEALDHESPLDEPFEEQLQVADLIVLNKCDAVSAEDIADAKHQVEHQQTSHMNIVQVTTTAVLTQPSLLFGPGMAAEDDLDSRPSHHDGVDEHEHDDFDSFVLNLGVVSDVNALLDLSIDSRQQPSYLPRKGLWSSREPTPVCWSKALATVLTRPLIAIGAMMKYVKPAWSSSVNMILIRPPFQP